MAPTILASYIPYGAHVIALFTLSFVALVLAILVTFSAPFIDDIGFIRLSGAGGSTNFGSFGWCSPTYCLPSKVGYEYAPAVNRALTGGMFLWPIAIIFCFFTILAILPLLFIHESRALRYVGNKTFFLFSATLSTLVVVIAWLISIYGWSIAHRSFELVPDSVHFGAAMWMGLVAALCLILLYFISWPKDAWDGYATQASGGRGRGLPPVPNNGYYHYKRSTREVVPRY